MIDPYKDTDPEVVARLSAASNERCHTQLLSVVEDLLREFDMSWDDLAGKLQWEKKGAEVRRMFGPYYSLSLQEINEIAHVFSVEPYIIFRPRTPWTLT